MLPALGGRMRDGGRNGAERRFPIGAEPVAEGVSFRVWAPDHRRVAVVLEGAEGGPEHVLAPEPGGYFAGVVVGAGAGSRYRFVLDDDPTGYPDPASRYQPEGPHGPSEVVDPGGFAWTDGSWRGAPERPVLYELHVGTFTPEGTWRAAAGELPYLADLGVTVLEVMPVAEFAGRFGWGYDGVDFFAPYHPYGSPEAFRAFVDAAHHHGLAVILDVVYNHLGPDGAYLSAFAEDYLTDRYPNEWGRPLNLDGPASGPVRELIRTNAAYWIEEFHLDGLRLDATQQMFDASSVNILAEIGQAVRETAAGRRTLVVAENEPQDGRLARPRHAAGYGLDALWNDDFHHAARVAATGRRQAYMSDYTGSAQELLSATRRGFLFQGQGSAWQGKRRGSPALDLPAGAFVNYLQNHDQVANTPGGRRLHELTSPGRLRSLAALLLLGPATPLLFMGEEFAASSPFLFFADHHGELGGEVRRGRRAFMRQFPGATAPGADLLLPDPAAPATFQAARLDLAERTRPGHAGVLALYRDLLRLRREDPPLAGPLDGAVLAPEAFALRWLDPAGDDRLLVVNLGPDLARASMAEPLLAPPAGMRWQVRWASEHPAYGGSGQPDPVDQRGWHLLGHAAVLFAPAPAGSEVRPGEAGGSGRGHGHAGVSGG